jgi:hypothetical protein
MGYLVAFGAGLLLARYLTLAKLGFQRRLDHVMIAHEQQRADGLQLRVEDLELRQRDLEMSLEVYSTLYQKVAGHPPPPLINSRGPRCWN